MSDPWRVRTRDAARRCAGAAAVLSALAVLAGCTPSVNDLPVFDREQRSSDLPPAFVDFQDTIDRDTVRRVGEDSIGTVYYAAEDPQERTTCLIILSETDWSSGCGGLPVKVSISSGLTATLEPAAVAGDEQVGDVVSVELPPVRADGR
ncbi:hypothetical protein ACFWGP_05970 [Agromyces sp. NPDC127015]|uniref:hypothetical protein n=1 Tax=Agromyces sp. NPDC127015 TaxID=3347108 RepID=UPI003663DB91